jgi:hypothetical protein
MSEENKVLHILPCHIAYTGEAAVENYFITQGKKKQI